jgi:hypothetical protein
MSHQGCIGIFVPTTSLQGGPRPPSPIGKWKPGGKKGRA